MISASIFVLSVNRDEAHHFSKTPRDRIRLIAGHGIEGDAHAGATVQHRYLARRARTMPNLRQVHLIQSELFDALTTEGFEVSPGDLGENVTTRGLDLLGLPLHARLRLGKSAVVVVTGLRTPCGYIDKFRKGLKRQMVMRTPGGPAFRTGVMGIVAETGDVMPRDAIEITFPEKPWAPLPALP